MVKDKSGEGGQTAVGLDPINEGVPPDVLQRGRAGMARQRSKSSVVLKRRGGRVKVRGCLVLMVEDTSSFVNAVIRELLVLLCLLLKDGLTVLSMWSESMSASCM